MAKRLDVLAQQLTVLWRHKFRNDLHALGGFQVLQHCGCRQIELQFRRVEDMKDNDIISAKLQKPDGPHGLLWQFIEVGNQDHQPSPPQKLRDRFQRSRQIGALAGFGAVQSVEDARKLARSRAGRNAFADCGVKQQQPDSVALVGGEVR